MKQNGFIATSLIYSFFLVFLMLMAFILARGVSNRVLLNFIKNDIRSELQKDEAFVVDELAVKTYTVGETLSYAGENWQVITNKSDSVVLILKRAITYHESIEALGSEVKTSMNLYFGTCNESSCRVRACRDVPAFNVENPPLGIYGRENCYYDSRNPSQYLKPAWKPTLNQIQNENYGERIISTVVTNWFQSHQGLNKALEYNKLKPLIFSDGYINYNESHKIYVRIPLQSEVSASNSNTWNTIAVPFHILQNPNAVGQNQIMIFGPTLQTVLSNTDAFIRPVIEVKKG